MYHKKVQVDISFNTIETFYLDDCSSYCSRYMTDLNWYSEDGLNLE